MTYVELMPHVTLSIPDETYKQMKRYPEVRWSEIIRRSIVSYLDEMQDTSSSVEIRNSLSENTLERLRAISSAKSESYFAKSRGEAWKRTRSLTQTC